MALLDSLLASLDRSVLRMLVRCAVDMLRSRQAHRQKVELLLLTAQLEREAHERAIHRAAGYWKLSNNVPAGKKKASGPAGLEA